MVVAVEATRGCLGGRYKLSVIWWMALATCVWFEIERYFFVRWKEEITCCSFDVVGAFATAAVLQYNLFTVIVKLIFIFSLLK